MQSLFISILAIVLSTIVQLTPLFKRHVLICRIFAAVILAAPLIINYVWLSGSWGGIGISLKYNLEIILVIVSLSSIAVRINYCYASQPSNLKRYPQLRLSEWTLLTGMANVISWILYLTAYEALFRGYFFFMCLNNFSLWMSCLINTVVYAAAHVHKGSKEIILSIPFGLLLCVLTWYTQSFWGAVFVHISLALSNDYFAWRANPEMKFVKHSFVK